MLRISIHIFQGTYFGHLTQIENADTIADVFCRGQIMGDEKIGQLELVLEPYHEVQ
jgi:hypothetical protein